MKKFVQTMKDAIAENLLHLLFITDDKTVREAYLSFLENNLAG